MRFNVIAVAVAAALLSFGAVAQEKKQESAASASTEQKAEKKAEGSAAAGATQARDPEMIKQVQQKLNEQGHNVGQVDGIMGPKTQKGLKDFQQAKGLKATGQLDRQTLAALGVSGTAGAGASAAGDEPASAEKKAEEKKPEGSAATGGASGSSTGQNKPDRPASGEKKY